MIVSGQLFPGVTSGIECGDPPTTPTSTPPIIDTVMTGLLIVGIDCAAVKATADELRARGGGTIRDTKFLNSIAVHRCFGQSPAK